MELFQVTAAFLTAIALGSGCAQANEPPHYRLQVRVEPASHRLEVDAWIDHPPSSQFYLYKGFKIHHVDADGKAVPIRANPSATSLPYSQGAVAVMADATDVQVLHVKYGGEMSEVIFGVNTIAPDLIELSCYSAWYPAFADLMNYTFELEANLPDGFLTTTNGLRKSERKQDDRLISSWTSYRPGFDVVLLASPQLSQTGRESGSTLLEIFHHRLTEPLLRSKMDGLAAGMDQLTTLYGPPRLKGIVRLVYSPRAGWGYARIPLIVVSEERAWHVLSAEFGEARDFRDNAHEMAHFWWSIADPNTPDDWMNEGLAEYTAFRLTEGRFGKAFADMRIAEYGNNAAQSRTSSCIAETETSSPDREINRYDKATLMFLKAQRRFGKEPLDRLIRALHVRFSGNHQATTDLFLEEVARCIGKEAETFFREELYRRPSVKTGDRKP